MISIPSPSSATFVRIKCRGVVWEVREGFQSLTSASDEGPSWFNLEGCPSAKLVKTGDRRTVWRVHDPGGRAVFVKRFDPPGFVGRLRARVSGSPARREAYALREAERRGIPAVVVLAVGEEKGDGFSLLVTCEQPNARPLPLAWDAAIRDVSASRSRRRRSEILVWTARLLTEAREKGLIHLDGHPGNILIAQSAGERPRAAFVDLARCGWARGPAPERRKVEAIAQLYQYGFDKTTRTDRLRFVRECVRGGWPDSVEDDRIRSRQRHLMRLIDQARGRIAGRLACHRDRRLRRDGKYFHRVSLENGWHGVVVTCLARRHRFPEPGVPDRSIQQWCRDLRPHLATVARGDPERVSGDSEPLFLHPMRATNLVDACLWTIVGSPARRTFMRCHRRRHRDEYAPLVLGYLERRGRPWGGWGLIWQAHTIQCRAESPEQAEPVARKVGRQ
ncbi:MAG: lipopolysaccharide kinase InaA family protein [Phycisphaerae bacterium]